MQKQTYISKMLNIIMLSALIYLSVLLIFSINNEQEMIEKIRKQKLETNEFTENSILKYLFEGKEIIKISTKKSLYINLLLNGSFAVILAGFITWTNILFTGTI
jgi:hypothetical protein